MFYCANILKLFLLSFFVCMYVNKSAREFRRHPSHEFIIFVNSSKHRALKEIRFQLNLSCEFSNISREISCNIYQAFVLIDESAENLAKVKQRKFSFGSFFLSILIILQVGFHQDLNQII